MAADRHRPPVTLMCKIFLIIWRYPPPFDALRLSCGAALFLTDSIQPYAGIYIYKSTI